MVDTAWEAGVVMVGQESHISHGRGLQHQPASRPCWQVLWFAAMAQLQLSRLKTSRNVTLTAAVDLLKPHVN
jgi:hypothetical protein